MTGFASASETSSQGTASAEFRSVNSRFLDLTVRLPDELRSIEGTIRERVAARVNRGKVECRIHWQRDSGASPASLNPEILRRLADLAQTVSAAIPQAGPLGCGDVLRWPGVIDVAEFNAEEAGRAALRAMDTAIGLLHATRAREGAALGLALLDRCAGMEAIASRLREQLPALRAAHERKLTERLNGVLAPALGQSTGLPREDIAERIRQEVSLFGMRSDVDEELVRLETHVAEVRRLVGGGGAVGRRLDFLMQELNREANTLGSKATAIELTDAAIELKLLIEQMREQVQNLE